MTQTQFQLPDALVAQVKALALELEITPDELARRGFEMYVACFPANKQAEEPWQPPFIYGGGKPLVPLECMKDIVHEEESTRSLPHE